MIAGAFLLLLIVPVVELWVIIQVAHHIGLVPALAMLVGVSLAGAWLLKREGTATWRRLQATLRRGQMPTREVTDGALILLGGALLLTPGFVTDAVGLLLLLPPLRALVKKAARPLLARWAHRRVGAGTIGSSYAAGAGGRRRAGPRREPEAPLNPGALPRPDPPGVSGGSRDRG